jgi:predicted nucleic acid-binding protein
MAMNQLLLDTSAYSAFMRNHTMIKRALQEADEIFLSPIILGELKSGFRKGKRTEKSLKELDAFLSSPRVSILDMDSETSERYAIIINTLWAAGTPVPTNDIWIASTAMQHGLRILTTDNHFLKISQVITDYFPIEA